MTLVLENLRLPARIRPETPMTDEELMRFCRQNEPLRVERDANGELIVMTPTGSEGGSTELEVGVALSNWTREDGRGKAFGPNAGFTLPDGSVRAADASWISLRRWELVPGEERKRFARICPEFVIEVRSESDRLEGLQAKMAMWVGNGAEVAWLVDSLRRVVEIYRPGEGPEELAEPTSVQGSGPVAGFELVLQRVWG